jgi:hypothetical protein
MWKYQELPLYSAELVVLVKVLSIVVSGTVIEEVLHSKE